jgi:hypothetical protein
MGLALKSAPDGQQSHEEMLAMLSLDVLPRGSGIFAGGWGASRAAVYGVPGSGLGAFYAKRTLLKREVLPEHVAAAVFALCGGDLSLITGPLIPVEAEWRRRSCDEAEMSCDG